MSECVAMLRPSEVPVAVSGTTFVMVLLVRVLMRAPLIIIGMRIMQSWRREEVIDCPCE